MQAFLRAGRSVDDIAAEAGVTVEWVERFAAPVLAEQAAAVNRAGAAFLLTPRRGSSGRPLTTSILRNLALKGIRLADEEFSTGWSAQLAIDTEWIIRFRYWSRGRWMDAEWVFDMGTGALVANNRLGADLGYVEPERRPPPEPDPTPAQPYPRRSRAVDDEGYFDDEVPARRRTRVASSRSGSSTRSAAGRPSSARQSGSRQRAAAPKKAARKSTTRTASGRPTAATKVAGRTTAAKKAASKVAGRTATAKKAAAKKVAAKKVAAKKVAAKKAAPRTAAKKVAPRAAAKKASATKRAATKKAAPGSGQAAKAPAQRTPMLQAAASGRGFSPPPVRPVPPPDVPYFYRRADAVESPARTAGYQAPDRSAPASAPASPPPPPPRRPRPLVAARFADAGPEGPEPQRPAPDRSAPDRSAPRSSVADRSFVDRPAPVRSAPVRSEPDRFQPDGGPAWDRPTRARDDGPDGSVVIDMRSRQRSPGPVPTGTSSSDESSPRRAQRPAPSPEGGEPLDVPAFVSRSAPTPAGPVPAGMAGGPAGVAAARASGALFDGSLHTPDRHNGGRVAVRLS